MGNYLKYIGPTEVSFPEGVSKGRALTATEDQKFESAWKFIKGRYHTMGKTELFGDDYKQSVKTLLGIELQKRQTSFEGLTPSEGLGMQPIHFADMTGNDGTDSWTNGATDTWDINWTTAGWRTWLGAPAAGAGNIALGGATASDAFGGHRRVVPADRTNNAIVWATLMWGVQDHNPAPKIHSLRIEQGKEVVGDHDIQDQMRGAELRYADLGRLYYFSHPQPFAAAVYIKALIANAGLGVSCLRPVGVTIAPALRLRQLAAGVRPQAAITN